MTPSPFLICFEKRGSKKLWNKNKLKNELGVTKMLYLQMNIIVCYIHQQHLSTTLFQENIFFSGNEVLNS